MNSPKQKLWVRIVLIIIMASLVLPGIIVIISNIVDKLS